MRSKCGHCGGFMWELSEESPTHSNYKLFFVRCSLCKVPVGVVDYYDTYSKLVTIEKTVKTLGDAIINMLTIIDANIRKLFLK